MKYEHPRAERNAMAYQKLQHFKRKCRSRGFTQEQIATMIDKKNHAISEQSPTDPIISEQLDQTNKRKRDNLSTGKLVD